MPLELAGVVPRPGDIDRRPPTTAGGGRLERIRRARGVPPLDRGRRRGDERRTGQPGARHDPPGRAQVVDGGSPGAAVSIARGYGWGPVVSATAAIRTAEVVASAAMPTIDANGLTIAYEVDGAGPPLVMLHGATGSRPRSFRGTPARRSHGAFRCYMPDARGPRRDALGPGRGLDSGGLAGDDVAGVRRCAGPRRRSTCSGTRWAAMTALHVAARFPERIRTLVVVGISTEREPRASVGRRADGPGPHRARRPRLGRATLRGRHDPVQGAGAWRRLLTAIVADIATQPCSRRASSAPSIAPTLVAAGDRDPFVPVDQAGGSRGQVPTAGCSSCPTSATMPSPSDRPSPPSRARRLLPIHRGRRANARRRRPRPRRSPHDDVAGPVPTARGRRQKPSPSSSAAMRPSTCRSSPRRQGCARRRCGGSARRSAARPTSSWSRRCSSTTARRSMPGWRRTRCARRSEPARDRARPGDVARPRGRGRPDTAVARRFDTGAAPFPTGLRGYLPAPKPATTREESA